VNNQEDNVPLSALMKNARNMREVYLAYLEAGFSEQQAMQIVCITMGAMITVAANGLES
jgi:hypothetical protein